MAATKAISVRIAQKLLDEATTLSPGQKVSEIISEALANWVAAQSRRQEDEVIKRALASISADQRREEETLVRTAGRSSLRSLEKRDG